MKNKPRINQKIIIQGNDNFIRQHIINGVNENNFLDIANKVFYENFISVSKVALEVTTIRLNSFHQKFVTQLIEKNPQLMRNLADPNYQYVLFKAQSAHVRIGDSGLEIMLLELLLDLAETEDPGEKNTLAESITIIPKLSYNQLLLVCLLLIFKYRLSGLKSNSGFVKFYSEIFEKIESEINIETIKGSLYTSLSHLIYTKCVYKGIVGSSDWLGVLRKKYDLLLLRMPEKTSTPAPQLFEKLRIFFQPVFENYWSCSYLSLDEFNSQVFERLNVSTDQISDFVKWLKSCFVSNDELYLWIKKDTPVIDRMRGFYNKFLPDAHLTPVGVALAKKFLEKKFDISFKEIKIEEGIDSINNSLGGVQLK